MTIVKSGLTAARSMPACQLEMSTPSSGPGLPPDGGGGAGADGAGAGAGDAAPSTQSGCCCANSAGSNLWQDVHAPRAVSRCVA